MDLTPSISFGGAALCLSLAVATLVLKRRSVPWLFFGLGMLLLAGDCALGGLTAAAMSAERLIFWQKIRLGVVALVPGTWLTFSLCYSRGNYREFLARW